MFTLTLHGEPKSTNHVYKSTCRGGYSNVYLSPEGKKIKQDYRYEVLSQWCGMILKENVTLTLRYYFKTKRKQDLDNYNKLALDALTGIVYLDDSQISALHLYRCYDKAQPRIEVTVH